MDSTETRIVKLVEGVYDPGILKAVFMAGGSGSGKSFVSKTLLGIPRTIDFSPSGIKLVNSDPAFEHFLKKAGYGTKLDQLSDSEFKKITDPNPESGSPRARARSLLVKKMNLVTKGRLGILIDGTGRRSGKILKQRNKLIAMGYDCFMIFVNTTLDKALERNANRSRTVPDNIVINAWNDAQKNISIYSSMFGSNLVVVDNSNDLGPNGEVQLPKEIYKIVNGFINSPIRNPKGRKWIERQLDLKRKR